MFDKRIKGHGTPHPKNPKMATQSEFEDFLMTKPDHQLGVIYIHIPFCDNICSFCSMNRTKLDDELDEYSEYLLNELDRYSNTLYMMGKKIDSVYFGGGTPTILKERHLEPIITKIRKNFNLLPTCEFSLESTLHNLNLSKLKLLKELGVNRFSIGIQTFSESGRKLLNRVHDRRGAIEHLGKIRENFDGLVCTDIIFNYPNQTIQEVIDDALLVAKLGVDSTSFYSLQFLKDSVLAQNMSDDYYDLAHEKQLHHAFMNELLNTNEYEILEHTKLNKIGRDQYKYIRLSHSGVDILPIGKGAGGRLGGYGIYNMSQKLSVRTLQTQRQKDEANFMNLFQYPKIDLNRVKSYLSDIYYYDLLKFFKDCENEGYLNIDNDVLNLTLDGVFWGNSIANKVMQITKGDFE